MTEDPSRFADELGPNRILHIYEPTLGLRAILVIDNVATGPAIGGVRMAADVSCEECVRLARAMTLKNASAGLAHGGGKAVIFADPAVDPIRKEELVRAFARAIGPHTDYIAGPDMGTNETAMAWIKDEIGRAAGLPRELGGIPLDEIGATGLGLVAAAEAAEPFSGIALTGARFAVQGFGAVGKHVARFMADRGAILVAAADSHGAIVNADGLDVNALMALKAEGRALTDYPQAEVRARDAIVDVECDIWIPAARPDVIREDNVARVRAKLIVQGANIGITDAAEHVLHARGVLCIPDFIANAGGVICAAVEYHGGTQSQALEAIQQRVRENTALVLARAAARGLRPRDAAMELAEERVRRAMSLRRWR